MRRLNLEVFDTGVRPRGQELGGLVYEEFMNTQDWSKGKAGTGEFDWGGGEQRLDGYGPELAESWETPAIGIWVLKVRRGVRWALNPASEASKLMNGREYTADDAVWSTRQLLASPTSWINLSQPAVSKAATIEKTGPWEVTFKTPVDPFTGLFWLVQGGGFNYHFPKEVKEKYGDMQDWRNSVGTGPFMLTDFVSQSVATLVRNPNYWERNPVGPGKGDQLPYAETVKLLIINDVSTQLAALRTGRADWLDAVEGEDARNLLKSNPKMQSIKYVPAPFGVGMRTDKQELPFKDKRVRQAMTMAIDFEALKKDLYGGEAEVLSTPVNSAYKSVYVPIEGMPAAVQKLYKYNPEEAKKLLAEAGYPNGFKTKMIVQNTSSQLDPAAVFKAMWAKVGIDVEIQPREAAVYTAINSNRSHEEMVWRTLPGASLTSFYAQTNIRGTGVNNPSYINEPPGKDPVMEKAFQDIQKNVILNMPEAEKIWKAEVPHILEQAYWVSNVAPYSYYIFQPWVKNYYGGSATGRFTKYMWVDQDLKEQITGKR